jgi:hypothetical protein
MRGSLWFACVLAASSPTTLHAAPEVSAAGVAPAAAQWVPTSDARSLELFRRAQQVAEQARSLKAQVSLSIDIPGTGGWSPTAPVHFRFSGDLRLLKPNYLRVTVTGGPRKPPLLFTAVSDGRYVYHSCPTTRKYVQSPATAEGRNLEWFMGNAGQDNLLPAFFSPEVLSQLCPDGRQQYLGVRVREGRLYDVVEFRPYGLADDQVLYFFGPEGALDGLELRDPRSQKTVVKWWGQNVELDSKLTSSDFSFNPPAGFHRVQGTLTESFFWPSTSARTASRTTKQR